MKKTITYGEVKDTCLDVINNGGGGGTPSEEYSTEEKAVGKWIDGRTIYRKVIPIEIDNVAGSTWTTTGITMTITGTFKCEVIAQTGTFLTAYPCAVGYSDSLSFMHFRASQTINARYLNICYLKD